MSKAQMLRCLVKQRLTEAAEEIFGLFERTIAEYEEEASRIKEDNERLKKHLHAVLYPEVRIQRADLHQWFVLKEEQQEDPEPPHIKEEQLQGLEKADMTVSFTPVKSEDVKVEAHSSQPNHRKTEQMETGGDGEDCGGPEPHRNSGPASPPDTDKKTGDSSETEDSGDWNETREPLSGEEFVSDSRCRTSEKPLICSECKKTFGCIQKLRKHMMTHTSEKPFSCSQCGKCFTQRESLNVHMRCHTGEKPFSCSQCGKCFTQKGNLKIHMRCHTGEKPFSCSDCGKGFTTNGELKTHMQRHTGEKPFSCSQCGNCFTTRGSLKIHERCHTGEKPFNCSQCGKCFTNSQNLKTHMRCHTGEKPFSCSDCGKCFTTNGDLKTHMRRHTGEKPFSCSECGKCFTRSRDVKRHMRCHTLCKSKSPHENSNENPL